LSLSAPSSHPPAEPHPVSRPGVTASALAPGTPGGPGVANAPGAASAAAASTSGSAAAGFAGLIDGFRDRLDREIAAFLAAKRGIAASTAGTAGTASTAATAGTAPDPAASSQRQATLADPGDLVDGVARLMAQGGKRLRPALVYYTYRACGGRSESQAMPLALATELLHTYLLIHDDIMDHAEVRRGQPAAHARFRDLHRAAGLRGDAGDFGRSVAILLGDLAHTYAVELFTGVAVRPDAAPAAAAKPAAPSTLPASSAPSAPPASPAPSAPTLPASASAPTAPVPPGPHWLELNRCFSEMCEEVIGGQYLEFLLAHRGHPEPASSGPAGADSRSPGSAAAFTADSAAADSAADSAADDVTTAADPEPTAAQARREAELLRVLRLKSGRYTAERPIQLGALLAGAPPALRAELSRYGTAVGEAFQLQDDLLGLFGDPAATGKPVGDDLREGKFTLLIHHALVKGSPADRQLVAGALGDPDLTPAEVARVQEALERTGARRAVNAMIAERLAEARRALTTLAPLLLPNGAHADAPNSHGPHPHGPHPHGLHPDGPHPAGPHAAGPDSPAAEGLRFLSGLLDFLWEREQ